MSEKTTGLILLNLGSPDAATVPAVRRYLAEFLMDGRVIDLPLPLRFLLVRGLIVPFRAPRSTEAYSAVWTPQGPPLLVISRRFRELLAERLGLPVSLAMRYGSPTPEEAYRDLLQQAPGLETILIAPLYPHYAMSSYETALEHQLEGLRRAGCRAQLRILKPFYNQPGYIDALAAGIQSELQLNRYDACLFSYHGLPVRHLKRSDPTGKHCYSCDTCCEMPSPAWDTCYRHQVKETTRLVAEKLDLEAGKVHLAFQSRLAGDKWLQPYTDTALETLPKQGVKRLLVISPAFVADCLETLEELDLRGRDLFLQNGGELYQRVPCLNTGLQWVDTLAGWCRGHGEGYAALWR